MTATEKQIWEVLWEVFFLPKIRPIILTIINYYNLFRFWEVLGGFGVKKNWSGTKKISNIN